MKEINRTVSVDLYRVGLFKKNLRTMLGAPWVRFYWSKGGCHICIDRWQVGMDNCVLAASILKRNGVEHIVVCDKYGLYWDQPEHERPIDGISIPIDQEALPERKRA